MEIHAFRLTPGQDLKKSLVSYAKGAKLEAGCVVTCVGSLQKVSLRLANAESKSSKSSGAGNETVSLDERFEIVSLTGTVSRHGCHLHISLADYQGNVVGGHVLDGCVVFTTAEIVLGECVGHVFTRETDDDTGFDELVVTTKLAMAPAPRRNANRSKTTGTNGGSGDSETLGKITQQVVEGRNGDGNDISQSENEKKRSSSGFFGWLGRVVAPDPPAKYAH